ncbi:MAG: CPBP family intramembrane metalloprotease [Planctomycetota bacterium]|nr:CPBP family intramembrane metalloprotease [Planctomycetota bacterium]
MTQSQAELLERVASIAPGTWAQIGAVAIVSTLALLPVAWLGVKRLVPARNIVFARWGFSHVALSILLFLIVTFAATLVLTPGQSLAGDLLLSVTAFGAVAAAIAAWAVRLDPDGVRVLGLRLQGAPRAILAGLLAYVVALPGIAGVMPLWTWILGVCGHVAAPQEVAARFAALAPDERALPMFLGIAVQPLLEEVVFRSFLQPLLVQNFREVAGVALTSVCFAALHGVDALLPIFALSCLLGAVMLRTQSLLAVWLLHALNNGIMFAILIARPELVGGGGGS